MRVPLLSLLLLLPLAPTAVAQPAPVPLAQHAFELGKVSPAALKALQAALPAALRKVGWIRDLKGVAGPMVGVTLAGRPSLGGMVCQPHDCHDNKFAFVVARDGRRAVAMVRSANVPGAANLVLGGPDAAETTLLRELLD